MLMYSLYDMGKMSFFFHSVHLVRTVKELKSVRMDIYGKENSLKKKRDKKMNGKK